MSDLSKIKPGDSAVIKEFDCSEAVRQRFSNLGLHIGAEVRVLALAPLGDPMIIETRETKFALRKADAKKLIVA